MTPRTRPTSLCGRGWGCGTLGTRSIAWFLSFLVVPHRPQSIDQTSDYPSREKSIGGTSNFVKLHQQLPCSAPDLESEIEREYRQAVFKLAAQRVRNSVQLQTWQAFSRSMIDEMPCNK